MENKIRLLKRLTINMNLTEKKNIRAASHGSDQCETLIVWKNKIMQSWLCYFKT